VLTRAWFAFSFLWAVLMCWSYSDHLDTPHLAFAAGPFLAGVLLKKIARYVVTGRLSA
jgi:hypothetical protein